MNTKDMENIDKIILKCENENEEYLKPEKMRDSNGNNIYAYVTLVMLGDSYIPAAIVLAQSLINSGSEADRVVLVTNDVSEEGKQILSMFFNHVIPITYIEIPNWRTEKQTWRKYLNLVFTKFHVFNLTQYKKIILIDADAIVLKHPDHIFSLNAPAGCFLENKDLFIFYNEDGSYRLPDGPIPWYEKFCGIAPHGSIIPKEYTERIRTNFKNSGIGGGLMLLEPKLGEFDDIIHSISSGDMKYLIEKKFVWPEQQYLTLRYSGLWHNINPRFFGLQGYPHWKVLYGLQYGGDKPFILSSKMPIEERLKYDDYILWHDIYREILNKNPELVESLVLKEVNQLAMIFLKNKKLNISRSRSNKGNEYDEYYSRFNLKLIYKDDPIHRTLQSYYHSDRFSTFNGLNPDVMFPDIAEYDYLKPISLLDEYYGENNFYKSILKNDITFDKRGLHKFNYFDNDIRDEIMLQYAKCRKDMYIITLWPLAHELGLDKIEEFIKTLENLGIVAYVKTVGISKNTIKNLMFWMYNEFTFQARLDFIKDKLQYSHVTDENNPLTFIFFDNTKKLQISGQNSKDKRMLRDKLLRILNLHEDKNIRGNDIIHINDYFYQTVEYSQMILNKNTLDVIKEQSIEKMINGFFSDSNLKYQTFRNALYSNFSLLEISRIVVIGGLILYAYGLRKFTDIDAIFSKTHSVESEYEKYLESIIFDNFVAKDTKIPFIDLQKEDSKHWKESLTEKNKQLFDAVNIKSTIDLITNPSNHFYFQGIKLYKLETEVLRKFMRIRDSNIHNKNKDLMDFLMIYILNDGLISEFITYDFESKELKINKKYEKYIGTDNIKIDNIQELKKIADKYYLRSDIKLL